MIIFALKSMKQNKFMSMKQQPNKNKKEANKVASLKVSPYFYSGQLGVRRFINYSQVRNNDFNTKVQVKRWAKQTRLCDLILFNQELLIQERYFIVKMCPNVFTQP